MTTWTKIRSFFTKKRRQALYSTAAVTVTLLIGLGTITEGEGGLIMQTVAAVGAGLVGLLQLSRFSWDTAAGWFVNGGRVALYAIAAAGLPLLVAFGLVAEGDVEQLLTTIANALAVLASAVAIIWASPDETLDQVDDGRHAA